MPAFPRSIDGASFSFGYVRVLGLALVILFVLYLSATVVPAGHVGVKDFFGSVSDRVLGPGISLVMPGTRVVKFSTQTRELLKWKAIEVAHELSKSPNAKIVVLGDKSGLPIILTDK